MLNNLEIIDNSKKIIPYGIKFLKNCSNDKITVKSCEFSTCYDKDIYSITLIYQNNIEITIDKNTYYSALYVELIDKDNKHLIVFKEGYSSDRDFSYLVGEHWFNGITEDWKERIKQCLSEINAFFKLVQSKKQQSVEKKFNSFVNNMER